LEKIEMKKTLVAVAALMAATGAMAEVTISGTVDLGVTQSTLTSAAGASSVRGGVSNGINGQDALNFGVSEQLDNGMTAYANINFQPTTDVAAGPAQDSGSGVGLRGDFGNVFLGRTWDAVMTSIVFAQPNYGNTQGLAVVHTGFASVGIKSNTISYTTPQLVPGLTATIQKSYGEVANNLGDSTTWAATYSVGGFTGSVAGQSEKEAASTTAWASALAVTNSVAGDQTITAGSTTTARAYALSYDFGMVKVFGSSITHKSSSDTDLAIVDTTFGLTIPLGVNTLYITSDSDKRTNTNGTTTTTDKGLRVAGTHALSKRTRLFLVYGTVTRGSSTLAAKQTALGMQHSF
jgi:predicted porin